MRKSLIIPSLLLCFGFTNLTSEKKAYCYVYVKDKYGESDDYVKVSGLTCGMMGGFTSDYETDKKGYVKLEWIDPDNELCNIYINGKERKGKYKHGGTYNFTSN